MSYPYHDERIENFIALCENVCFTPSDEFQKWLVNNRFFTAPASTKYHGAYEGGLYDHSKAVAKRLIELTHDNNLEWQRPESPFIVGMFHDLCKCDQYIPVYSNEYESNEDGKLVISQKINRYEYNTNTLLKGHGAKSVMLLSQFINLTEEEILCIRYHMGAYGNEQEQKDEWKGFDQAIRKYQNVLWTHQADQLASKVDDV
jgi:23S rRNA maturation-related 3'-5' exoribonuclease YhaM